MTSTTTLLVHGECGRGNLRHTVHGPCCTVCGSVVDAPGHAEIVGALQPDQSLTFVGGMFGALLYAVVSA